MIVRASVRARARPALPGRADPNAAVRPQAVTIGGHETHPVERRPASCTTRGASSGIRGGLPVALLPALGGLPAARVTVRVIEQLHDAGKRGSPKGDPFSFSLSAGSA